MTAFLIGAVAVLLFTLIFRPARQEPTVIYVQAEPEAERRGGCLPAVFVVGLAALAAVLLAAPA